MRLALLSSAFAALLYVAFSHPHPLMRIAVLWGLCVGSFLNVVVYRLPIMARLAARRRRLAQMPVSQRRLATQSTSRPAPEPTFNLAVPRSACPRCGHQISAWENIPVLSYLLLRGACRGCKAPISAQYPCIELLTGALTLSVLSLYGLTWRGLEATLFGWLALPIVLIELRTGRVPASLLATFLGTGFVLGFISHGPQVTPMAIAALVAGGAAYLYSRRRTRSREVQFALWAGMLAAWSNGMLVLALAPMAALLAYVMHVMDCKQPRRWLPATAIIVVLIGCLLSPVGHVSSEQAVPQEASHGQ